MLEIPDSFATFNGGTLVGNRGEGTLNLLPQDSILPAALTQPGIVNEAVWIGRHAGSNGTITVAKKRSMAVNRANRMPARYVGQEGKGLLRISDGGRMTFGDARSGRGVDGGTLLQIGGDASDASGYPGGRMGRAASGSLVVTGTDAFLDAGRLLGIGRTADDQPGTLDVTVRLPRSST